MRNWRQVTVGAQAGSVGAGSVCSAPGVAGLDVAEVAVPTLLAGAVARLAAAVRAAVHVAAFCQR